MSKKAVIKEERCDRSPFCPVKRVCPAGAVKQVRKGFFKAEAPVVDRVKCTGCGLCVKVCPMKAVRIA